MAQRLTNSSDTSLETADLVGDLTELFARIAPVASTYTPTLTSLANVAAATANANVTYTRLGDVVRVSGTINIDPTAASVTTTLGISLPVASDFNSFTQLAGSATRVSGSIAQLVGGITADLTNDRAQLNFLNDTDVIDRIWSFQFSYSVI